MNKFNIPDYKKVFTEFLIIVIGVFVALAAESWWSDRESRQFEADLIEDMKTEFRSNIEILESDIQMNIDISKNLKSFATLTDTELNELEDEFFEINFTSHLSWAGFDPIIGNIQALVESGNLSVISDRKLRLLLSRWSGLYIRSKRFNLQAVTYQNEQLEPLKFQFASDLTWEPSERRLLWHTVKMFTELQDAVIETQQELLVVANEINTYLSE